MRKWYRLLVAFTVVSAVFCTSAVVWLGVELWTLGDRQEMIRHGSRLQWRIGAYEADGILSGDVLDELVVRRVEPVIVK